MLSENWSFRSARRGVVAKTTFERDEGSGSRNATTLCLFAIKDILVWQELLYDYGISDLPWKSKVLTKAGLAELERPSVTVNANVANEEVSADLNSLTPINSRNKFSSTNAKSSVADAVNPDKTEKDGNKSTDSKLADKDPFPQI
ncbi:hypothetical protein HOLleu_32232 [Holothuria leucospilota]|uniref:Uncharacterized protein n=1 Tax=Holothuria leucospilota TaxID=206669 RepID=A0A9Q1BGT7_HOLLE|nr:hypothetical protein HOLleu_32232 [Holothuria leucospilota]